MKGQQAAPGALDGRAHWKSQEANPLPSLIFRLWSTLLVTGFLAAGPGRQESTSRQNCVQIRYLNPSRLKTGARASGPAYTAEVDRSSQILARTHPPASRRKEKRNWEPNYNWRLLPSGRPNPLLHPPATLNLWQRRYTKGTHNTRSMQGMFGASVRELYLLIKLLINSN